MRELLAFFDRRYSEATVPFSRRLYHVVHGLHLGSPWLEWVDSDHLVHESLTRLKTREYV